MTVLDRVHQPMPWGQRPMPCSLRWLVQRRLRWATQTRGALPVAWCPRLECFLTRHSQTFPSPFLALPRQMNFALFQVHAPGFPTFLPLLKFFAPSGMSFCLLLCQISKYYWSLRPCAKSCLSVQLEMVIAHFLFPFGGTFLTSPCRHTVFSVCNTWLWMQ